MHFDLEFKLTNILNNFRIEIGELNSKLKLKKQINLELKD